VLKELSGQLNRQLKTKKLVKRELQPVGGEDARWEERPAFNDKIGATQPSWGGGTSRGITTEGRRRRQSTPSLPIHLWRHRESHLAHWLQPCSAQAAPLSFSTGAWGAKLNVGDCSAVALWLSLAHSTAAWGKESLEKKRVDCSLQQRQIREGQHKLVRRFWCTSATC